MPRHRSLNLRSDAVRSRQGCSAIGGGFERDFMLEILEPSGEVRAYAKLVKKHQLKVSYRGEDKIKRDYEVDFLVRTGDGIFLVETKADKDLELPVVALKARAAQAWCERASTVKLPEGISQPLPWEYLLVSESLFRANRGLSFSAFIPMCRALRDQVIARQTGKLFL